MVTELNSQVYQKQTKWKQIICWCELHETTCQPIYRPLRGDDKVEQQHGASACWICWRKRPSWVWPPPVAPRGSRWWRTCHAWNDWPRWTRPSGSPCNSNSFWDPPGTGSTRAGCSSPAGSSTPRCTSPLWPQGAAPASHSPSPGHGYHSRLFKMYQTQQVVTSIHSSSYHTNSFKAAETKCSTELHSNDTRMHHKHILVVLTVWYSITLIFQHTSFPWQVKIGNYNTRRQHPTNMHWSQHPIVWNI